MFDAINVDYEQNPRLDITKEKENTCYKQAVFASEHELVRFIFFCYTLTRKS